MASDRVPRPGPPPAQGLRQRWADIPERVRRAVEHRLGSAVVSTRDYPTGFSPGFAGKLSTVLTPSPLEADRAGTASEVVATSVRGWRWLRDTGPSNLDDWSTRHLDRLVALEEEAPRAVAGRTLLHMDIRADNLLLGPDRVWFVDWPHATVGAGWFDLVCFAPSVAMQGGPPPEVLITHYAGFDGIDDRDITAAIAAIAGFFTHRSLQPPPPGLPTVRAFQAAQALVAREWLSVRLKWT